jgi:hypothetical protein
MLRFSVNQYVRLLMVIADKQYVEDPVFWNDYMWNYVKVKNDKEQLEPEDAKAIWEALVYLKLKCPAIDTLEVQEIVEQVMD